MIKNLKFEYLLVFIAVIWTFLFTNMMQLSMNMEPKNDEVTYIYSAKLLVFEQTVDNTRPLLISAIFGIPYFFGGTDIDAIKFGFIVNYSCWMLTVLLLFKILTTLLSRKNAFIWTVLFIFFIGNLAHTFVLLSESIFIFLIVLAVYFLSKYYKTLDFKYIAFALSILIVNALIKPVSIGLALIVFLFFILKSYQVIINKYSFLILLTLLLLFFQMYSLKKTYGDFTISYIGAITYYNYLGAKADCLKKNIEYLPGENVRTKNFNILSSHEIKKIAGEDFIEQLKSNKTNLLKAYLFCIYSNSSNGNLIVSNCKNDINSPSFDGFKFFFKAVSKLQTIFFTICAVLLSFYTIIKFRKQSLFYSLVACLILYIFFISAISCFECDRFHIAFYPLMIILLSNIVLSKKSQSNY